MIVLGIESTAHSLGIGVFDESKGILANEVFKYPSLKSGYLPRKLVEFHSKNLRKAVEKALEKASLTTKELDAIAYSQAPGIGHCLHFGYVVAKAFSEFLEIPLIPVNHAIAHIEVGKFLCNAFNPLVVYVSGGNTQIASIALINGRKKYFIHGETLDIGLGNFLDQVGRMLELNPPDAVGVLNEAKAGEKYVMLPYTVKGMNLAFSGLLTAVEKKKSVERKQDLCMSAQETAFSMLVEASERCLCHTKNPEVLLCGGNARNKRLQEMLKLMAQEHDARFCVPPDEHCGDAGAMISYTGWLMLKNHAVSKNKLPKQKMRIDEVEIKW